jgi:hypothetical protein
MDYKTAEAMHGREDLAKSLRPIVTLSGLGVRMFERLRQERR